MGTACNGQPTIRHIHHPGAPATGYAKVLRRTRGRAVSASNPHRCPGGTGLAHRIRQPRTCYPTPRAGDGPRSNPQPISSLDGASRGPEQLGGNGIHRQSGQIATSGVVRAIPYSYCLNRLIFQPMAPRSTNSIRPNDNSDFSIRRNSAYTDE